MVCVALLRVAKPQACVLMLLAYVTGLLALSGAPAPSFAEATYPTKPIKFIVAVGAGGATDTSARRVGDRLARALGQSVVVENQPSASGIIAARAAMRSAPLSSI